MKPFLIPFVIRHRLFGFDLSAAFRVFRSVGVSGLRSLASAAICLSPPLVPYCRFGWGWRGGSVGRDGGDEGGLGDDGDRGGSGCSRADMKLAPKKETNALECS